MTIRLKIYIYLGIIALAHHLLHASPIAQSSYINPSALMPQVQECVKQAGKILVSYFGKPLQMIAKTDGTFTTQADLESETYLIESLSALAPEIAFLSEESGAKGSHDYCWVIDPLDGTTNYWHGIPYYGISVALTYQDKPILGIIYDPTRDHMFWAVKDTGAFCNTTPLHLKSKKLSNCVVLLSCAYKAVDMLPVTRLEKIRAKTHAIRSFGSAALDMAHVALGIAEIAILRKLSWWDVAAGLIILEEAGAKLSTISGKEIDVEFDSLLACHPEIYPDIFALCRVQ